MDNKLLVQYWIHAAELDLPIIDDMFDKKNYAWSLFICHLVIEKILKALYAKTTGTSPPKTHDLVRLAQATGMETNEDLLKTLDEINEFNLEARYPDEKFNFYKKCTYEFTSKNIRKVKELYQWLKSLI